MQELSEDYTIGDLVDEPDCSEFYTMRAAEAVSKSLVALTRHGYKFNVQRPEDYQPDKLMINLYPHEELWTAEMAVITLSRLGFKYKVEAPTERETLPEPASE